MKELKEIIFSSDSQRVSLIKTEVETEMLAMLIMMLSHLHLDRPGRLNSTRWEVESKGTTLGSHSVLSSGGSVNLSSGKMSHSLPKHHLYQTGQLVSALSTLVSSHWDRRPSVLTNMSRVYAEQRGREEHLEKC